MLGSWGNDLTSFMKFAWRGSTIQDPNHLSRVSNDAHDAGIYSHGGQVRTQGILDVDSTNSRFLASALDFRNAVCRRTIPGYSTASQELSNMQTDLLLGLVEQNRTMRRIHEALEHAGVHGVLHEIKIDGSSWCVPGQGGPDNYKAWVGGDYRTNVESSVRSINSLIMEWNMLKAAEAIVLAHLPSEPAEHDSQCVLCILDAY